MTDSSAALTTASASVPPRGRLKVFVGAAPGVGKTFAMLQEAQRLRAEGGDVAVVWLQTYGRPRTEEAAAGLERIPTRRIDYRGIGVDELDLDTALSRRPAIALVDELAHTNVPGAGHQKRWEDVEALLCAGIEVWTTVNIQHVESLRDIVERATGVAVRETVPDHVLDEADEITLADITPEALRKRLRHGNVYPLERVEAALNNFFREGNLAALRELAIWYVVQHRSRAGGREEAASTDRVLILTFCGAAAPGLVRRGVRMGRRLRAPVTVLVMHQQSPADHDLELIRQLSSDLGAQMELQVSGDPLAEALERADSLGATHLVVAAGAPSPRDSLGRSLVAGLLRNLGGRHLHVIGRRLGTRASPLDDGRPDPQALLQGSGGRAVRGTLRLYLGYAPGVGKSTRLLEEALRRQRRGAEVVVVASGGRPGLDALLSQLKVVPALSTGGIDIAAVLRRNPSVLCVDDLGIRDVETHRTRYQQIRRVLNAGVNVVGTIGVVDLPGFEAARARLGRFRGDVAWLRAPVPPRLLDSADEIELVDLPPAELRERVRAGLLADAAQVDSAMEEFSESLLEELRSAALRRVATHTEQRRQRYFVAEGSRNLWPVEERIMVALTPGRHEQAKQLLEAGLRAAAREDASVIVIAIVPLHPRPADVDEYEQLAKLAASREVRLEPLPQQGGMAASLLRWAREHEVTAIFMLAPRARRWMPWDHPLVLEVIQQAEEVDIHLMGREQPGAVTASPEMAGPGGSQSRRAGVEERISHPGSGQ
ncbi:MAG: hypothetical protein ACYCYK_07805 [Candidatus Dormibacteria bacterium]